MKYFFIAYKRIEYNQRIVQQCHALQKKGIQVGIISIGNEDKILISKTCFKHILHIEPIRTQLSNLLKKYFRKPQKPKEIKKSLPAQNKKKIIDKSFSRLKHASAANLTNRLQEKKQPPTIYLLDGFKAVFSIVYSMLPRRFSKFVSILFFTKKCLDMNYFSQNDCFHAHDLYALPTAWLLSKKYNGKLVYDAVEFSLGRNRLQSPGLLSRFIILLTESLSQKADVVITAWPFLTNYLKIKYNVPEIMTIYNCPKLSTQKQDILRRITGATADDKLIVYLGYLTTGRGLEHIIRGFRHLDYCFKLVIIGPAVGTIKETYQKIAGKEHVSDRVHILDPVSIHEVVPYASSADIGLLPLEDNCLTHRYCLPNKLFQYIMAGCPILCSDLPGIGNFVKRHKIGETISHLDPQDIADTLRRMDLRAAHYKRNIEKLKQDYHWEKEEKKFLRIIKENIIQAI
jgi:glycosyltransferase involved in cell wall biosynthesis